VVEGMEAARDDIDEGAVFVEGLVSEVVGTDIGPEVLNAVDLGAVGREGRWSYAGSDSDGPLPLLNNLVRIHS